ncbi:MAG: hypothetical protein IH614_14960 [Desulfuromonadales bacterium]|nr:hypothetical protein [Desulfuromonadales bacterium]
MLIRVKYPNGRFDMVQDYYLEALLAARRVCRFQRDGIWVEVNRDPVRCAGERTYSGPERRGRVIPRPLELPVRVGGRSYRPFA